MARLTKLGALVDKMLDNPDNWALYLPADHLLHKPSGWILTALNPKAVDFLNYPSLSRADVLVLGPKAHALREELQKEKLNNEYRCSKDMRYHNRKHIYTQIMKSVMGIE